MIACSRRGMPGAALRGLRMLLACIAIVTLPLFGAGAQPPPPPKITNIANGLDSDAKSVGLNDYLAVSLDGSSPLTPANYVLYLNGRVMDGLTDVAYDNAKHALVFRLERNSSNATAWAGLLGSARDLTIPVTVALGVRQGANAPVVATLVGDGTVAVFDLAISSIGQLAAALVAIVIMLGVVWGGARKGTLLKDSLLPQLAPTRQPYSLGRWQMAFWFTLIFISFVVLYVTLWDYNTVTTQALVLMGLSGTTGIFAMAVDIAKNTPVDDTNNALRALGLNTYADVQLVRQEISQRKQSLSARPAQAVATQLQAEIDDRELLLTTYEQKVKPFVTAGWYRDLTTDINGSALHRVQVFCWTWVLGAVFIIGVWRNLAMPAFDDTLLALMGISSAGYIGFKYPEQQN